MSKVLYEGTYTLTVFNEYVLLRVVTNHFQFDVTNVCPFFTQMPLPVTQSVQHVPTAMTPLAGGGMSGVLAVPGTPAIPASMPVMHSTPSHGRMFYHPRT